MGGFTHESVINESVEWYTPQYIFDALNCTFDLDPCSPKVGSVVPAVTRFSLPEQDGLVERWFGRVWLNPPYGKETGVWLRKLADHGDGIALVFARTGTRWFQEVASEASLVCFVSKRIRFISGATGLPGSTPGADSLLIAFGDGCAEIVRGCGLGVVGCLRS